MLVRIVRILVLSVAASIVLVPTPGCGSGGAAAPGTVIKDPPPLPLEETTEALLKQKVKAKPRASRH
ncbi:hypothetical protein [Paludisphaera borealis]|uniref:Uncharacterized protein n=1 Tax=Paludisphaera borealis TaxID=1387353 RepID=A0A1U7CLI9_9BACT|nr:hypothetical protein [Paludisphaera borealis]APW59777.1 hypothetical protein BSF38_01231 [Paludisphaera borealis]